MVCWWNGRRRATALHQLQPTSGSFSTKISPLPLHARRKEKWRKIKNNCAQNHTKIAWRRPSREHFLPPFSKTKKKGWTPYRRGGGPMARLGPVGSELSRPGRKAEMASTRRTALPLVYTALRAPTLPPRPTLSNTTQATMSGAGRYNNTHTRTHAHTPVRSHQQRRSSRCRFECSAHATRLMMLTLCVFTLCDWQLSTCRRFFRSTCNVHSRYVIVL